MITPEPLNRWLADHYGSRRGFLLTMWHRFLCRTGFYLRYKKVDWSSVDRLVFVCKGNICRSVFAEVVARQLGCETVSCGIDTRSGMPADTAAVNAAVERGYDLEQHRTTPLQMLACRTGDLYVVMEPAQLDSLEQILGKCEHCTLLGMWGGANVPYIHDPFGSSEAYFSHCFERMEKSVYEIARKIQQKNSH